MSKLIIGFCAFVMLVTTPSVHADPTVITSGSVSVGSSTAFTISGQNFSVTGNQQISTITCTLCFTGNPTTLDDFGGPTGQGTVTINGVTFNNVNLAGSFEFRAGVIVLPSGTSDFTRTSPFQFVGDIRGCLDSTQVCANEVFSITELVGHGIATVQFFFVGIQPTGASEYRFGHITYQFQSDVPEPATILLFASGVIGMGIRLIPRRRFRG